MAHTHHPTIEERLSHIEDTLYHSSARQGSAKVQDTCSCGPTDACSKCPPEEATEMAGLVLHSAAQALKALTVLTESGDNASAVEAAEVVLNFALALIDRAD